MWIRGVIWIQVKMFLRMEFPLLHSSQIKVSFVSKEKMSRARILGKNPGTSFLPVQHVLPYCPKCGRTWTKKPHGWVSQMPERVIKRGKKYIPLLSQLHEVPVTVSSERWHGLTRKLLFLPAGVRVSGYSWETGYTRGQWPGCRWKENSDLRTA